MGQRLVRAKTRIREAGIPFRVPERDELAERLDAVLEAIYAAFAEGWADPAGTETRRRNLAAEGIWLGRLVVSLLPDEPEALGLLALMLYAEARRPARRDAAGDYVPLAEQDTALWDAALIDEAEALLRRASRMGVIGRYQLEAAVQSAHVVAPAHRPHRLAGDPRALRRAGRRSPRSPVVGDQPRGRDRRGRRRRAGAGRARRPRRRQAPCRLPALLGRPRRPAGPARPQAAAREAYERAIGLERDPAVRAFLQQRQSALP